jgi:hypothetical protein
MSPRLCVTTSYAVAGHFAVLVGGAVRDGAIMISNFDDDGSWWGLECESH